MMNTQIKARISDVLDVLEELGLPVSNFTDEQVFYDQLEIGFSSGSLRDIFAKLINELNSADNNNISVAMETEDRFTSSLIAALKSLGYPYHGDPRGNKLLLLEFLATEVQASRILSTGPDSMNIDTTTYPGAQLREHLQEICDILQVPCNHDATKITTKVYDSVSSLLKALPPNYVDTPMLSKKEFDVNQLKTIEDIHSLLKEEYALRYNVLKKRLNVTVQGFSWSEKAKDNHKMQQVINDQLQHFPVTPDVELFDLFTAQPDLAVITKTNIVTKIHTPIKSLIIGDVPDRGGRPTERHGAMPVFKPRDTSSSEPHQKAQRTSGGRGRVQGAWGDNNSNNTRGGHSKGDRQGGGWGGARGRGRGRG